MSDMPDVDALAENYQTGYENGWETGYDAGVSAERARWVRIATDRLNDLMSCHKNDDCHTIARGADLVLSDGLWFPEIEGAENG